MHTIEVKNLHREPRRRRHSTVDTLELDTRVEDGLVTQIKRNPRPELAMASPWQKISESSGLTVGSRRSRAAAFGDDTNDKTVASTNGRRGQAALEAEGVTASSSATTVGDAGEPISHDSRFVMQCSLRGAGFSPVMPASHALNCPSRVLRSGAQMVGHDEPADGPE